MTGFISEVCYNSTAAGDFVEVVFPAGTDVGDFQLALYNNAGNFQRAVDFGDAVSQSSGFDVYLIDRDTHNFGQINQHTSLALINGDREVIQFVSFEGKSITARNGPAKGETSTNIGEASGSDSLQSIDGVTYEGTSVTAPGTVPCFAPDTLIDCEDGLTPIKDIKVGDLVRTFEKGLQPVRLIRTTKRDCRDRGSVPIHIPSGVFGWGKPNGNLIVSAQHRIFLDGKRQGRGLVDKPVFIPAQALVGWRGVRQMQGRQNQHWVHLAFDRHEVIRANGCLTESLLLGPMVLQGMSRIQRDGINKFLAKHGREAALNGPPKTSLLSFRDARRMLETAKCG